jgi:hypothetical protein
VRALVTIGLALASAPAFAQHEHVHDEHHHPAAFAASVALVAASYDTMSYAGSYQGFLPSVHWVHSRFAAIVSGSMYRLEKNGATLYGVGDAAVHGQARLVGEGALQAGLVLGVSAPTGNAQRGFGMGHVMLMPAAYGSWTRARMRLGGSLGYSRAISDGAHADHGPWPLVSPMLQSELSWQGGAELLVTREVVTGLRASGGIPIADEGSTRMIVGARIAWRLPTLETALELQAGVLGDPFNVRGVASTTLSF